MSGIKGKRKELGDFLKLKRSTVSPEEYGLPIGPRRKTKGLRREELAQLSGIGVTWYTWLEQGRDIQVSTQVLESISRVLKLNYEEKKHVFLLAGQQIPMYDQQSSSRHLSPVVQNLIQHNLKGCPVYITDEKWDVIAWNEAACAVFGDFNRMSKKEKNAIWRCFCSEEYQSLLADWESHAKRLLAQFRATASRFIGEEWIKELTDELSEKSPEFHRWWNHHEVLGTPPGEKEIRHPLAGVMFMEHVTLQIYDSPDLKLTVYRPLEKEDTTAKLNRLLSARSASS